MSSILRALKKLENDPRHLEKSQPLDTPFVPLADTAAQQKRAPGFLMIAIGGGAICGLVILAGWWLFSDKHQAPPIAAPQKISRENPRRLEIPPPPTIAPDDVQSAAVRLNPADLAADRISPPETTEQAPVSATAEPLEDTEQVDEPAPEEAAVEAPSPIRPRPAEKTIETPARVPVPPAEAAAIQIPLLDDPEMKLQAITWSKEPQKRLAIINSRILREGESVAGYRIDTINPDDIMLSQKGETWKLPFRIK